MLKIWLVIYVLNHIANSYPPITQTLDDCNKKSEELMVYAKESGYSYEYFHTKCEYSQNEPKIGTPE